MFVFFCIQMCFFLLEFMFDSGSDFTTDLMQVRQAKTAT